MKYLITLLLLLPIISYNIFSQTFGKVYEHPKMYGYVAKHRQIAIIPFNYKIALKRMPKRMTQEDVIAAEKQYEFAKKSAEALQESFTYNEQKFNEGMLNVYDYNDAKNKLIKAESDLLQAKYDYLFKVKILDFFMGKPLTL